MALLDWITGRVPRPTSDESDVETVRRIARELDEMDPERARYIACFAYILGRVAHADLDISDEETAAMEHLVAELAGLPEGQAVLVVSMAKQRTELFGSTDNFLVTREFDRLATPDQKLALLDCLFAVSASDGTVSAEEDTEIRRIASELKLPHRLFIAARMRFADSLSFMQD